MARLHVRGPNGAEVFIEVPSPGMDERTFEGRVAAGELTVLDDDAPEETVEPKRPAGNAPKADWVDWAVSQGLDRDEAEALTKAQLTEL